MQNSKKQNSLFLIHPDYYFLSDNNTLSKQKVTYLKQCSLIAVDVNVNRRTSYSLHSVILPVTKKHYFLLFNHFLDYITSVKEFCTLKDCKSIVKNRLSIYSLSVFLIDME